MAITLGDTVRVSANILDVRGADVVNVYDLHVTAAGTGGNSGFKDDCVEYLSNLYTTVLGFIDNGAAPRAASFYHRNGGEVLTPIAWGGITFAATGEELPLGTAALVYARTDLRHTLSRKYLGPTTEGMNGEGGITGAGQALLDDFMNTWLAPFSGSNGWDLQAVLWSDLLSDWRPLQEPAYSSQWVIQRRRRLGRGS